MADDEVRVLAEKIVRLCYSDRGVWIGTENIRLRSSEFIRLVYRLGVALGIFVDVEKGA